MSDSMLKKEFKRKDVERLRNLVKGKYGNKTTTGIGYQGSQQEDHKEGDIWEERGKTWTIKDGIKENITKLDNFKKVAIPLFCPKCKQVMDKQLDPFYFKSFGECVDCRTITETQLKLKGKWNDYVSQTFNSEVDQQVKLYQEYLEEVVSQGIEGYVSENGEVQKWVGGVDKKRAKKAIKESIKNLKNDKK